MNLGKLLILTLGVASGVVWAGPVSATPGVIQGVITFNGPFVPDVMTIDARDSANLYTAHANAAQNNPATCAAGSPNWCYSMVVESALASSYYLRPIAFIAKNSPVYLTDSAPFPQTALVPITKGATVTYNITYQPGEISGTFQGFDLSSQPLQITRMYLSVNDLTNTFPEPCGGSLDFCPFNSVFNGAALTLPAPAAYELFLKPAETYNYLSRGVDFQEAGGNKTSMAFNYNQPLGPTPAAGANVTKNYTFNQVASVSGGLSAPGQSIYGFQVTAIGSTVGGTGFFESYGPANNSPTPLQGPLTYLSRIFDFTDFTQPVYIQPLLTLSPDGTTQLQYPPVALNPMLASGQQRTLDFTGTSATISGRVTFDPPYPAGNIYPGVQAETQTPQGGIGSAQTTLVTDAQGGTYSLPAFGGDWQYWRFGWNFNLGNPNLTTNYLVGQYLNIPVNVANGQTLTGNNFNFDTARVKVYFSAPAGTTISDPQLDFMTGSFVGGNFVPDFVETGHSAGLNQTFVTTAEADAILRVHNVPFRITPSAVINPGQTPGTGRTDFSPIVVIPNKGDVIIVGVPGTLSVTVTSPKDGQNISGCQVTVTGSATGAQNITITVNGQTVQTTSANNPNDPNQVLFSTTVPGNGPNTQITVMASAPGNTTVTDVLTVSATSPVVNVSAQVGMPVLWPPNHDLVNVGFAANAQTACGVAPSLSVKVYSNESDTDDTGTGNFSPDAANIATGTLRLREERDATGQGRVYLIVPTAGSGYACATVVVPKDQSAASTATVNAMASAAAASCQATGQPPAGYVQVGPGPVIGPKQ